jgi:hypothetical protein
MVDKGTVTLMIKPLSTIVQVMILPTYQVSVASHVGATAHPIDAHQNHACSTCMHVVAEVVPESL